MIPENEFILLDKKAKDFGTVDVALTKLQMEFWSLADKYNTDGPTVAMEFFVWKSKNLKENNS